MTGAGDESRVRVSGVDGAAVTAFHTRSADATGGRRVQPRAARCPAGNLHLYSRSLER